MDELKYHSSVLKCIITKGKNHVNSLSWLVVFCLLEWSHIFDNDLFLDESVKEQSFAWFKAQLNSVTIATEVKCSSVFLT